MAGRQLPRRRPRAWPRAIHRELPEPVVEGALLENLCWQYWSLRESAEPRWPSEHRSRVPYESRWAPYVRTHEPGQGQLPEGSIRPRGLCLLTRPAAPPSQCSRYVADTPLCGARQPSGTLPPLPTVWLSFRVMPSMRSAAELN